ncbi:hypothetical protein BC937DRAFT_87333 [Endogone sp. FLAS-F59071]|nr:hypothetical protein BC937DRAFT_87333 [Endogone sp. FLAS-F59071]|eukprot:RUS19525.1 hypothetical protein BC937DRAFT_87333 [Endogone sp. FLAS-F59071]
MDQYHRIFNTCRMPSKPADYQKTFDPAQNNHIVIMRHDQLYVMETWHEKKRLSTTDLETTNATIGRAWDYYEVIHVFFMFCNRQFANIIARADESEDPSIGVLTTENRDVWANVSIEQ